MIGTIGNEKSHKKTKPKRVFIEMNLLTEKKDCQKKKYKKEGKEGKGP